MYITRSQTPPPPNPFGNELPNTRKNRSQVKKFCKAFMDPSKYESNSILVIRFIAMSVFTYYGFKKNTCMFKVVFVFSAITYLTVKKEVLPTFFQELLTLEPYVLKKCPDNSCSSGCSDLAPVFGFKHKSQVIPLLIGFVFTFACFSDNHKLVKKVNSFYTSFLLAWKISYIFHEVYFKETPLSEKLI